MPKSEIILKSIQIKNLKKAKRLAYALNIIEEECGIKKVNIVLKDVFLCGWIDIKKLNKTKMQKLLRKLLRQAK